MRLRKQIRRDPLYAQVAQALRAEIVDRCHPGQRLDSEDKLAQQLGISLLTLRHSLGVLAHEGLIERRQGSGTYVADRKKYQNIAIATTLDPSQSMQAFHMRLFHLLGEKFKRAGYQCRFYAAPIGLVTGWSELVNDLERGQIAGTAFITMNPESLPIPVTKPGVPYIGGGFAPTVELDFGRLVHDGVRHLLERGCRRIALMQWSNPLIGTQSYETLRSMMAGFGVPLREDWIRGGILPTRPGAGWAQFREIWTSRKEKPDGLLVTDDILFRDVAMAILECGIKVPQQLHVVTHANKGSGLTYPFPVNRMEVDVDEWAEAMMNQLIKLMNRELVEPRVQHINARLVPAESGPESRLLTGSPASTVI